MHCIEIPCSKSIFSRIPFHLPFAQVATGVEFQLFSLLTINKGKILEDLQIWAWKAWLSSAVCLAGNTLPETLHKVCVWPYFFRPLFVLEKSRGKVFKLLLRFPNQMQDTHKGKRAQGPCAVNCKQFAMH